MKPGTTSRSFPTNPKEVAAAIARAPERVDDPECPYDPNDPTAVAEFWKRGSARRPGQRGPGRKPKKVLLSVRYSPEVVEYFQSTGKGWPDEDGRGAEGVGGRSPSVATDRGDRAVNWVDPASAGHCKAKMVV
jgi:uncharacterized protein (DUF4415 family)